MPASSFDVTGLAVTVPSTVQAGVPFFLGLRVLTTPYEVPASCQYPYPTVHSRFNVSPRQAVYMENVPPEWTGTIRIEGPDGCRGPAVFEFGDSWAGSYAGDRRPIARVGPFTLDAPGVHFLRCRDEDSGISAHSNPMQVLLRQPTPRLYWADTHSPTIFTYSPRYTEKE